jgi:hypothetical protein
LVAGFRLALLSTLVAVAPRSHEIGTNDPAQTD